MNLKHVDVLDLQVFLLNLVLVHVVMITIQKVANVDQTVIPIVFVIH